MRLPGFTAESSLYQTGDHYQGVSQSDAGRKPVIRPQRIRQRELPLRVPDPGGGGGLLEPIVCYYSADTGDLIWCSV